MSMFPNNKTVLFSLCILLYYRAILITRVLSTIVRCLGGPLSQQTAGSQRGLSTAVLIIMENKSESKSAALGR